MKTLFFPRRDERGSTLMIAVVALATISFLLLSYMNLTAGVNRSVVRSQVWNEALTIAEAGIEEAMMNLNYNGVGGLIQPPSGQPTNGWYSITDGAATARWLTYAPSNSAYTYYYVTVKTNGSTPTVTGYGWSRLPPAYGGNNWQWINRIVRVTATRGARHPRGMLAKSFIDMNGNNITTDSYDSDDPNYSTDGRYDTNKFKQNGDLGTNLTLTNSVNVGNANIKGSVATGPGGSIAIGPSGFITGSITHDMNVDFPDVLEPFTAAPGLQPGVGSYTYTAPPGNTKVGSLSMAGGDSILVTGPGLTKLYFTGDLSITGNASITLATNATLEIYVGGASAKIAGNGVISPTGKATAVAYYGLPGNTRLDMSGNGEFTGTVYAPNAAFTASGGGNELYDLAGAIVVKTITLNGHFNLHYDEALGKIPAPNGLTITSWKEL